MARLSKSLSTRLRKALQRHRQPARLHHSDLHVGSTDETGVAILEELNEPSPETPELDRANAWPQEQSLFFSKLPPEIRDQIYREVFGNAICHIVSWQSGLRHYRCRGVESDKLQFDAPCWGHIWCDTEPDASVNCGKQRSSLLTTCKRS